MHSIKALSVLLVVSFLVPACGTPPEAAAVGDRKNQTRRETEQARRVQTMIAGEKDLDQLVIVTGTIAADQEVALGFKVPGRVAEIPVDLGTAVQKGSPIARLDATDFELRVRQSDAALQQARVRLGLSTEASDQSVNIEQTSIAREARAGMEDRKSVV